MGLDCSHDAWSGAYSAFNRLRQKVCEAMGGSFPPHKDGSLEENAWYCGDGYSLGTHPGLTEFFNHSDCDGEISPEMCKLVADELEALLPKIEALDDGDQHGGMSFTKKADGISISTHPGHIARAGGYASAVRKFIAGCRLAAADGEPLEFS